MRISSKYRSNPPYLYSPISQFVHRLVKGMAQVVELDAGGDFVIELSSQLSEKPHLLVSSKVLTLPSPVLGKMFEWETRAREGGENGVRTPVIPLPDDDDEVFTIICQIAHHKMEDIPDTLKPGVLTKFAEVCHKV